MIIDRVMIKSTTIEEIRDFTDTFFQLAPKNIAEELRHARNNYPNNEMNVIANILGLRVEYYIYHDSNASDLHNRRMGTIIGRCITAVEGHLFDSDPLFENDLLHGLEFTVAEMLANFMVFGIKNYLGMMSSSAGIDMESSISWDRNDVNLSEWIVMQSEKSPFLLQKASINGLSIPKIRDYYSVIERDRLEEGGTGMEVKEMEDMTFDDFRKMMGF